MVLTKNGKTRLRWLYKYLADTVDNRPMASFFTLLAVLIVLIIAGNLLRRPAPTQKTVQAAKSVGVYHIGQAPRVKLTAEINKSGVIQITALTGGVVQNLYAAEGQTVSRGQWLVSLASNYQGANIPSLSREIAQKQWELVDSTYPDQKSLINRQRDLAGQVETNFENLRDITKASVDNTQHLIDLNTEIIKTLDGNINILSAGSSTDSAGLLLSAKQMKSQFLSANLQLDNALRQSQYQVDTDKPPTQLVQIQKDIAQKQLTMQEKSLDLNREISKLQLELARAGEGAMFPSAPFAGRIERIWVRPGQSVSPGTTLVTLASPGGGSLRAIIYTTREIANRVSVLEPTDFILGSRMVGLTPTFVSREATNGDLYSVIYDFPEGVGNELADKADLIADVPLGYPDTGAVMPFVPIDSVYQTQESSYLFIINDGLAKSLQVDLGPVVGDFVQVARGLKAGDTVILDRNVISGDQVKAR